MLMQGNCCPYCQSSDLYRDRPLYAECTDYICNQCGASWSRDDWDSEIHNENPPKNHEVVAQRAERPACSGKVEGSIPSDLHTYIIIKGVVM